MHVDQQQYTSITEPRGPAPSPTLSSGHHVSTVRAWILPFFVLHVHMLCYLPRADPNNSPIIKATPKLPHIYHQSVTVTIVCIYILYNVTDLTASSWDLLGLRHRFVAVSAVFVFDLSAICRTSSTVSLFTVNFAKPAMRDFCFCCSLRRLSSLRRNTIATTSMTQMIADSIARIVMMTSLLRVSVPRDVWLSAYAMLLSTVTHSVLILNKLGLPLSWTFTSSLNSL